MAEFPALPLWTDAYLGDTMHLDATEHGAYLLLLISAWRTGDTSLPDDDIRLAKYARCTPKVWRRIRPILAPFFEIEGGKWMQLRLRAEKQYVSEKRERLSANGRASALKRKDRHATKRPAEREQSDQQNANKSAAPTPTPSSVGKPTGAEAPPDPVKIMFDSGVALLKSTGTSERAARTVLGKWRKERGEAWVIEAITDCRARSISDPIPWIEARMKSNRGGTGDPPKMIRHTDVYRELDQEFAEQRLRLAGGTDYIGGGR